ncbi:MAG: hypothetical protein V3U54_07725 [Thermodesulfobacteriota bacterium]
MLKNSHTLSAIEKNEIMTYLKANPTDQEAIPDLMKKYNCTETTITCLVIEDMGLDLAKEENK